MRRCYEALLTHCLRRVQLTVWVFRVLFYRSHPTTTTARPSATPRSRASPRLPSAALLVCWGQLWHATKAAGNAVRDPSKRVAGQFDPARASASTPLATKGSCSAQLVSTSARGQSPGLPRARLAVLVAEGRSTFAAVEVSNSSATAAPAAASQKQAMELAVCATHRSPPRGCRYLEENEGEAQNDTKEEEPTQGQNYQGRPSCAQEAARGGLGVEATARRPQQRPTTGATCYPQHFRPTKGPVADAARRSRPRNESRHGEVEAERKAKELDEEKRRRQHAVDSTNYGGGRRRAKDAAAKNALAAAK